MIDFSAISKKSLFVAGVAFVVVIFWYQDIEVSQPSGILISKEPDQVNSFSKSRFKHKDYILEKLADYKVTGRVLGKSRYILDAGASLAPFDLALGWKVMSNSDSLKKITVTQGQRFAYYQWTGSNTLSENEMFDNSSNTHIIPGNDEVHSQIKKLRVGDVVILKGSLVAAYLNGDMTWKSSLSRKDRGSGACELMHVTSVQVVTDFSTTTDDIRFRKHPPKL